jgi:Mrp family chromosome partitioning ATPase
MSNLERPIEFDPPVQAYEQFRLIKHRLLDTMPAGEGKARTILVTSPQPGEGKSFTALNLALALASGGEVPVTLVDGDWYRRRLAHHFGMGTAPGLAELLADDRVPAERLLRPTATPRLSFLPPGHPPRAAGEPMPGRFLAQRIDGLQRCGGTDGITIVDAPPALATAEASLWAAFVGRIILVVHSHKTSGHLVRRTLPLLVGCPQVECILNMADSDLFGYGGYD